MQKILMYSDDIALSDNENCKNTMDRHEVSEYNWLHIKDISFPENAEKGFSVVDFLFV